jgi:two-component system phosphate regulon response regulator PhoB
MWGAGAGPASRRFAHRASRSYGAIALRNIVFRFDSSPTFSRALHEVDQELALPLGEHVSDGEWVLTIFEIGGTRRATAAAARGLHRDPAAAPVVAFARRDWERLVDFADSGSARMPAARPALPPEPATERSIFVPDGVADELEVACESDNPPTPDGRVLLVDDDPEICSMMTAILTAAGLSADSAPTAEEALERLRAGWPDLVVLDWNLPGMTGLELCRIIRKDSILARLPVLFLTANATPDNVVEAFASGADDYVVKPFRAPELGARIFSLLRRARMAPVRS